MRKSKTERHLLQRVQNNKKIFSTETSSRHSQSVTKKILKSQRNEVVKDSKGIKKLSK